MITRELGRVLIEMCTKLVYDKLTNDLCSYVYWNLCHLWSIKTFSGLLNPDKIERLGGG